MSLKQNIFSKEWCDIVFAGRNKDFGAYQLRKEANRRLIKAFLIVSGSVSLTFAIPSIIFSLDNGEQDKDMTIINLSKIKIEETPIPDVPKTPITADDFPENKQVTKEKPFNPEAGIKIAADGKAAVVGDGSKEESAADSSGEEASLFMKVEESPEATEESENTPDEMASINGEEPYTAFRNFIAKNLKYPQEAVDKKIEGIVYVQFLIEKDGSLSHIVIVKGVDQILDNEVLRLVKLSPIWIPAKRKGKPVRVAYTFPVAFQLN